MRNKTGWIAGIALLGFAIASQAQTIRPEFDDTKWIAQVSFLGGCSDAGCTNGCSGAGCADDGCSGAGCSGAGCSGAGCSGGLLDGCSGGLGGGCGGGSGIEFGGWLAWGWYDNSHGLDGMFGNSPLGFNNIAERPVLNQAWVYAGKEADLSKGVDFGFRCDFMFGADGPDTVAFGDGAWDASWQTSQQYGFAMPQLYGEIGFGGDTIVRFGHFYTIIGYEVVQAPNNFFYSHAYTMYYNEPFTHTGVLVQKNIGDATLWGGWTMGWDSGFDNRNEGSTFLGGISAPLTDRTTVTYATTFGDPGDDPALTTDVFMNSLIFDTALTDSLNHVLWGDFQTRRPNPANGQAFKQYAIINYLTKQLNDCWAIGLRHEWLYAGENAGVPLGPATLTPGVHYHDWTIGLNYRPTGNLLIKPEVRYDYIDFDGAAAGGPFDRGTARSQFTYGFQSILTF